MLPTPALWVVSNERVFFEPEGFAHMMRRGSRALHRCTHRPSIHQAVCSVEEAERSSETRKVIEKYFFVHHLVRLAFFEQAQRQTHRSLIWSRCRNNILFEDHRGSLFHDSCLNIVLASERR